MYFTGNYNYLISPCGSGNSPLGNLAIQSCPSSLGKSLYFICIVNVGKHNYIQASFVMTCEMSALSMEQARSWKIQSQLIHIQNKTITDDQCTMKTAEVENS